MLDLAACLFSLRSPVFHLVCYEDSMGRCTREGQTFLNMASTDKSRIQEFWKSHSRLWML